LPEKQRKLRFGVRQPSPATVGVAMAFARNLDMISPWAMQFAGFSVMKAADLRSVLGFVG
jgi:hypothetical protein